MMSMNRGGMRRLSMAAGLAACALLISAASAAPLPQRHSYQKTLRDYFATLTEADFTVELKPVLYVDEHFAEADTVARYWMLFATRQADIPDLQGILVSPAHFTLAAIEAGETVNVAQGRGQFMDPKDVAWWTRWAYPGNPYYESGPLKRRAFVMAAADMMMQDEEHEAGKNLRSDYLGGSMIRYAYTFHATRDAVPAAAREAYAAGLVRMFEKLERLTPRGSGGSDMEFFQLPAMWYAADALGGDFPARALARAHVVIDTITSKTGYEKHGGAFDVSYQGIALRFLTWGAMLYRDPKVNEALHKMLVLKSHLSLPEPNGQMHGPTHFNTGTAGDAPNDQWAWVSRDLAMAMIDDMALYTIAARNAWPAEDSMRAAVKRGIGQLGGATPSDKAPAPWKEVHWTQTLNFAHDLYEPGFFARLLALKAAGSPLIEPLYSRNETFIRDLNGGGEFLAVKFPVYAAVLHTGAIAAKWASGVSGKSGGGLSAFWTPASGSVLMGRCRATQSDAPDEWTDANGRGPYTWAVHAVTGRGADGGYFSSSRIRDISSTYEIDGDTRAVVSIAGNLGASATADPQDVLKGSVAYVREVRLDAEGAAVRSAATFDGQDRIRELWELLPVHVGPKQAGTELAFRVKGEWQPATADAVEADRVRVTRYGAAIDVVLETPRRAKVTDILDPRGQGGMLLRNIMIDLLAAGDRREDGMAVPAGERAVSYRIQPAGD